MFLHNRRHLKNNFGLLKNHQVKSLADLELCSIEQTRTAGPSFILGISDHSEHNVYVGESKKPVKQRLCCLWGGRQVDGIRRDTDSNAWRAPALRIIPLRSIQFWWGIKQLFLWVVLIILSCECIWSERGMKTMNAGGMWEYGGNGERPAMYEKAPHWCANCRCCFTNHETRSMIPRVKWMRMRCNCVLNRPLQPVRYGRSWPDWSAVWWEGFSGIWSFLGWDGSKLQNEHLYALQVSSFSKHMWVPVMGKFQTDSPFQWVPYGAKFRIAESI